jgi:hypothetical protein
MHLHLVSTASACRTAKFGRMSPNLIDSTRSIDLLFGEIL